MDHLTIPIVLGTARAGRESEKAANFLLKELIAADINSEIIDVKDYLFGQTFPSWEDHDEVKPWREKVVAADALIIVSPEYNHSFPGELKILLDSLLKEYEYKPVAICGVSGGGLGGVRMVEHLKQVLLNFKMVVMNDSIFFSNVKELFNTDGSIKDASYKEKAAKFITEVSKYARMAAAAKQAL